MNHEWPERLLDDRALGPAARALVNEPDDELRLARNFAELKRRLDATDVPRRDRRAIFWRNLCFACAAAVALMGVGWFVTHKRLTRSLTPTALPIIADSGDAPEDEVSTSGVPRNVAPRPYASLQAELGYVERATTLALDGRQGEAADELGALLASYPKTSLRDEVRFRRADYLMSAKRYEEAVTWIGELLARETNGSRRRELSMMLADAFQEIGNCAAARKVYDNVMGMPLSNEQRSLVEEARRRCDDT